MMTHEELISLIGNMFTDTYFAGARNDLVSFLDAKAQRDHLFDEIKELYDEIKELYAELEHVNYLREQNEVELKKVCTEIQRQNEHRTHAKLNMAEFYGKKISHVDDRSIYPSADDYPITEVKPEDWKRACDILHEHDIPDDADKFSEQDLPFPDVEDLAPASEVEGSEE